MNLRTRYAQPWNRDLDLRTGMFANTRCQILPKNPCRIGLYSWNRPGPTQGD